MKMRLEWFIAPCVASIIGGTSLSLHAQDAAKVKRNLNVVVNHIQEGADAEGIRAKVAKELEKSGISEETKARILKDVEEALNNAKAGANKTKKVAEKQAKQATDAAKFAEGEIAWRETPANANSFTTKLFASPRGDGYRIGIQCNAPESEEGEVGSEGKVGLEVQAVVDDSPAEKAGILEGDFLLTVNGAKISKIADLTKEVQEAGKADKEVTIELKRDEKTVNVSVKPTKMKTSDVELENIRLSLPTGGFVFDADAFKGHMSEQMKEQLKKYVMPGVGQGGAGQVFKFESDSSDLKKEMAELKSEMADLKKMLKEMINKK